MTRKQKKTLIRVIAATAMLIPLFFLPVEGWLRFSLFLLPYFCVGYDVLIRAGKGVIHLQPFDENFLMAVATVGAMAMGEYAEGVAVMLFYQIGELFQSIAVGKSRRSIADLMDIRPDRAELALPDGTTEECDPTEVPVGSVIVIRPGDRVPLDGEVIDGTSSLDTATLTGESLPRTVGKGDAVVSGCVNLSGVLRVRTAKEFEDSTVSRILELVENASSRKSRSEKFITKFARVYTPAVVFSALALAFLPPLILLLADADPAWTVWFYRALTFLVISCPCALVISIPLGFFAGLGGAGSIGILIKGSDGLETLSRVRTVAFDKTGTVTEGVFEVTKICPAEGFDAAALTDLCAHAECFSTHPIAASILRAYGKKPDSARVRDVTETAGDGVVAEVDGKRIAVGNRRLLSRLGVSVPEERTTGTAVYLAVDGRYAGSLLISDRVKPGAAEAFAALEGAGVRRTVMLTGDHEKTALAVASEVGIREVRAELLPADKVAAVETLLSEQKKGEKLAFVGDGINDAPVLARADVGIAMGALGSDAAIEAADVVLMDDDPGKIAKAIAVSRKCLRIVRENIVFSLAVKALCLIFGALGLAGMWWAIFADVGVMVLAVLNAVRALAVKNL